MNDKKIKALLKTFKFVDITDAQLPPLEDRIAFVDEQINQTKNMLLRIQSEIATYTYFLEVKGDDVAQEFGENQLRGKATELKSYKLTLEGLEKYKQQLLGGE